MDAVTAASSREHDPSITGFGFRGVALLVFVLAALAGGGGGIQASPLPGMVLELAAIAMLVIVGMAAPRLQADPRAHPAVLLMGLTVIVIALQLVPLPPALWQALPGRAAAAAVRTLAGPSSPAPISLDAQATIASGLCLLLPFAGFLGTLYAGRRVRHALLLLIAVFALVDLVLGTMQIAAGGVDRYYLFDTDHRGIATGFFANRNQNADLLLIGSLAAIAILRTEPALRIGAYRRVGGLILFALFALGIVTTASRAGMSLLAVSGLGALVLFSSRTPLVGRPSPRLIAVGIAALVLAGGAALALSGNAMVARALERFGASGDHRFEFWPEVLRGIGAMFPFGSGLGTFEVVFRGFENLDTMKSAYVNHAHNDYMEVAFELGLAGVLLLAAAIVLYLRTSTHAILNRRGTPLDPFSVTAILGIAILLLHSLVDYPMRTHALATLAGVLAGLLFAPPRLRASDAASTRRR